MVKALGGKKLSPEQAQALKEGVDRAIQSNDPDLAIRCRNCIGWATGHHGAAAPNGHMRRLLTDAEAATVDIDSKKGAVTPSEARQTFGVLNEIWKFASPSEGAAAQAHSTSARVGDDKGQRMSAAEVEQATQHQKQRFSLERHIFDTTDRIAIAHHQEGTLEQRAQLKDAIRDSLEDASIGNRCAALFDASIKEMETLKAFKAAPRHRRRRRPCSRPWQSRSSETDFLAHWRFRRMVTWGMPASRKGSPSRT